MLRCTDRATVPRMMASDDLELDIKLDPDEPFQTRRANGEIRSFATFAAALADGDDPAVWKISFPIHTGERVRLVRQTLMHERVAIAQWILSQMPAL